MPIVAEKTIYHLSTGDVIMSNRVRFYPYKVTYINLHDYLSNRHQVTTKIALHTDIVTALHADNAKAKVNDNTPGDIVILSASRYPQRHGRSVVGVDYVSLTDKQRSVITDFIKDSGRGTPVPHKIAPSAFVPKTSTPFSDRFRPTPKVQPEFKTVPAPPTVFGDLSVGGFSFGASKPAPETAATPIQVVPPESNTPTPVESNTYKYTLEYGIQFFWIKLE